MSSNPFLRRDLSDLIFETKHERLGGRGPQALYCEFGLGRVGSRRHAQPLPIVLGNLCILSLQHESGAIAGVFLL